MRYLLIVLMFLASALAGEVEKKIILKSKQELDLIVIPKINLSQVTLVEALSHLNSRASELDVATFDPAKKGVTLSVKFNPEAYPKTKLYQKQFPCIRTKKLDYNAESISLTNALIGIAKSVGFNVYLTSSGIVLCPPGVDPFPNSFEIKGELHEALHEVADE